MKTKIKIPLKGVDAKLRAEIEALLPEPLEVPGWKFMGYVWRNLKQINTKDEDGNTDNTVRIGGTGDNAVLQVSLRQGLDPTKLTPSIFPDDNILNGFTRLKELIEIGYEEWCFAQYEIDESTKTEFQVNKQDFIDDFRAAANGGDGARVITKEEVIELGRKRFEHRNDKSKKAVARWVHSLDLNWSNEQVNGIAQTVSKDFARRGIINSFNRKEAEDKVESLGIGADVLNTKDSTRVLRIFPKIMRNLVNNETTYKYVSFHSDATTHQQIDDGREEAEKELKEIHGLALKYAAAFYANDCEIPWQCVGHLAQKIGKEKPDPKTGLPQTFEELSQGGLAPPFSCPIIIPSTTHRMTLTLRPHQQRMLDALLSADRGRLTCPTGGGKTLVMILDTLRRLQQADRPQTIVVVSPRILLSVQLYEEFFAELNGKVDVAVMHVHSGEVEGNSTTKIAEIQCHAAVCAAANTHQLIFTTYNSLRRINEAGIDVDTIYYDEAHNSVRRDFFKEVAAATLTAKNAYYLTATPKYRGGAISMNNTDVYGSELINVPAPELISNGSIIPPTILPHVVDIERHKSLLAAENDRQVLSDIVAKLDGDAAQKILVAAPNTRVLWALLTGTNVMQEFADRGYDVLHITSKHGAYVNKTKVGRQEFFDTLDAWGKDPSRKFIMFHYSILSEGINVPGLTHTILLRNLPVIEMAQTIGRVIRLDRQDAADIAAGKIPAGKLDFYRKRTGFVTVPVFTNYGKQTEKRLQRVVDSIFVKGVAATEFA